MDIPTDAAPERRANHGLRGVFADAYELVVPFFDPANSWGGGTHEHLAIRAVREEFPQLSVQDAYVVVATAKQVIAERRVVIRH